MARLLPFFYASLCLLGGVAVILAFRGPGESPAGAIPVAQQGAVIPDAPEGQDAAPTGAEAEEVTPQVKSQVAGSDIPAIPSSSINLTREQQAAAQEMQISPPSQEADSSGSQSASAGSPTVLDEPTSSSGDCKWEKSFLTTAYGPPWNAMEGGPETATGKALKSGRYYVAVDPSVIPLGSQMKIWPNPHNYRGLFTAEDTGGAIKGNKIDIFVWQGKSVRDVWKKNAKVCLVRSGR